MKLFVLLTVIFLIYASNAWAQKCSTQMSNSPGDIIESHTDWWDQGENGFSWQTYIDGVQFDDYGAERLPNDGPCLRYCTPFRFVAKSWDVRIDVNITSGNASGWKCAQPAQVVGHWEPPPPDPRVDLVAISPEAKAEAQRWADGFERSALFANSLGYVYTVLCTGTGDLEACGWAAAFYTIAKGMGYGKAWADYFVKDPWDENYGYPYEPQFYDPVSQLGYSDCAQDGSWVRDFCAWNNEQGARQYGYWEAAYVSANRAASCAYVANEDCFWWQKARMEYFLWAAGVHTGYMADGLSIATNILGSQETSDAAAELHETAQRMESICGSC